MHEKKKIELANILSQLVGSLSEKEKKDVLNLILGKKEGLPISIFKSNLSGLETITLYLRDIKEKSGTEVAEILNRKRSTIYTTYKKAKKKLIGKLDCSDFSTTVPLEIFTDRTFSILESLVYYLREDCKFSIVKISKLLNKSYSTVRTVYKRYQKKNAKK